MSSNEVPHDLQALLRVIGAINSALDVDEQLPLIMDAAIDLTLADRGFIKLFDRDGKLEMRSERSVCREASTAYEEYSQSVVKRALDSGEPVYILDSDVDTSVEDSPSIHSLQLRTVLCSPLRSRVGVIGVLYVDSTSPIHVFSQRQKQIFQALVDQAAIALENARLLAADRAKGRFLANTSHELRTPLNSIIGFSAVLLGKTRAVLEPRLYGFLENIHSSGTHLLALINDVLDLSKVEAGRLELRPERFNIRQTVVGVERVMQGIAADSEVRIETRVDRRLGDVRMDEPKLKEILINLLSNAVRASRTGGVVYLDLEHVKASRSPLSCDTVRITVEDNGPGLTQEQIPRIFEEFYQADSSTSASRHGTGLGLTLTKRLVHLHRGTINVESTPGCSTTFTVHLPAASSCGAELDSDDVTQR